MALRKPGVSRRKKPVLSSVLKNALSLSTVNENVPNIVVTGTGEIITAMFTLLEVI